MTKQQFLAAHPDFVWWLMLFVLMGLVVCCGALYRYKHPQVEHDERHHHYGSLMLWFMSMLVLGVVGWIISVIWHKDFWAMLHTVLS